MWHIIQSQVVGCVTFCVYRPVMDFDVYLLLTQTKLKIILQTIIKIIFSTFLAVHHIKKAFRNKDMCRLFEMLRIFVLCVCV